MEKNLQIWALVCGCAAVVSNLIFLTLLDVPASIPLSIFGIAFALASRSEKVLPKMARVGMVLCVVGLIFGVVVFLLQLYTFTLLQNPIYSAQFTKLFEELTQGTGMTVENLRDTIFAK